MSRPTAPYSDATVRAAAIAHCIRLGKTPPLGSVLSFKVQVLLTPDPANITEAEPVGEKIPYSFVVTAEDLAAGRALINSQAANYQEPKTTTVKLSHYDE